MWSSRSLILRIYNIICLNPTSHHFFSLGAVFDGWQGKDRVVVSSIDPRKMAFIHISGNEIQCPYWIFLLKTAQAPRSHMHIYTRCTNKCIVGLGELLKRLKAVLIEKGSFPVSCPHIYHINYSF